MLEVQEYEKNRKSLISMYEYTTNPIVQIKLALQRNLPPKGDSWKEIIVVENTGIPVWLVEERGEEMEDKSEEGVETLGEAERERESEEVMRK